MLLAAMQPYSFAYLGYYQLINAADQFVILDDVAFSRRSWVHRNTVAGRSGPVRFCFPVKTRARGSKISQMILHQPELYCQKFLRTIDHLYKKAPFYSVVRPALADAVEQPGNRLDEFAIKTINSVCQILGITTPMVRSSKFRIGNTGDPHDRIFALCKELDADGYINAEGGMELYSANKFRAAGVALSFLQHVPMKYPHTHTPFIERLSIIDVLMFCGPARTREMLGSFRVLQATEK